MVRAPRRLSALVAVALAAVACTPSPPAATPTPSTQPVSTAPTGASRTPDTASATAVATSLATTAPAGTVAVAAIGRLVRSGPANALTAVDATRSAVVGDTVATDASGLAELRFADASLTRLGPRSSVVLTELTAAAVQRTRMTLSVGDTWHEVTKLTAPGSRYEVLTPVGVAAVRGTRFAVSCDTAGCTITVVDGVVRFTPLAGPAVDVTALHRLTVSTRAVGQPVAVTLAALAADPWIGANLGTAVSTPTPGFSGRYALTRTITAVRASGNTVGQVGRDAWTVAPTCLAGGCNVTVTSANHTDAGRQFAMTYAGGTWTVTYIDPVACNGAGAVAGTIASSPVTIELTAARDDGAHVTRLTGTEVDKVTPCRAKGAKPGPAAMFATWSVVLVRQ